MKNNEKALAAFMKNLADSKKALETLTAFVENHMNYDPDEINWGHAGVAGHLADMLQEAIEAFGLENAAK